MFIGTAKRGIRSRASGSGRCLIDATTAYNTWDSPLASIPSAKASSSMLAQSFGSILNAHGVPLRRRASH
ncbi:MAG: hypothetical protein GKR94_23350 [Gammaproteobacteria bacterium]|nr:hypothetical protein [Gammaproteobacteria bacterium]